jgi:hypothetical protein
MLTLWRRHLAACPHRDKGRDYEKCNCPIWCDGDIEGGPRIRKSMKLRDWARAVRKRDRMEDPQYGLRRCLQPGCDAQVEAGRCDGHKRGIDQAIGAYHDAHQDVGEGTKHQRKRSLSLLGDFLKGRGLKTVDQIDLDALNTFRSAREVSARTWVKELGNIRHFLKFCLDNDWMLRNWALKVSMPRNLKPATREPYAPAEIARMVAACDQIGRGPYERLRARAMLLLLRYTALRISDVATLGRDRIRNGEIFLRTTKNGKAVKLPVPPAARRNRRRG